MLQTEGRAPVTGSAASPSGPTRSAPTATIHVLVPAHNKERTVGAAIDSVRAQTLPPSSVTVLADNCTDHTVGAALIEGAAVYSTVDNTEHKAGALNQYLRRHLLLMDPQDYVVVLGADSTLDPRFLEVAVQRMTADPRTGAVGGGFTGQVRTGTATIYRVRALIQVAEQRESLLPGRMGDIYDTAALTEDDEIMLALGHLGWRMVSPRECVVHTQLMPTIGELHTQRLRWYRGAIESLRCYGWTPVTARFWLPQLGLLLGTVAFGLFVLGVIAAALGGLQWSPWWSLVSVPFLVERLVTVWRVRTRRGRLLALVLLPEIGYDLVLQATFARAAVDAVRAGRRHGRHYRRGRLHWPQRGDLHRGGRHLDHARRGAAARGAAARVVTFAGRARAR